MVCAYRASYVVLASNGMSAHTDVMGQPEPMETPLSSQVEDISFDRLPSGLAVGNADAVGWLVSRIDLLQQPQVGALYLLRMACP